MREEPVLVSDIRAAMRDEAHLSWYTCLFVGLCSGTTVVVTGVGMLVPEDPDGWLLLVAIGGLFPALALFASLAMAAVFFIRWLRRAYADVTHLEGIPMPFTRSQLLWAWVIPFLNLVRPHSAVRKLAQVSHPGDLPPAAGEQETPWDRPVPINSWWGAWLASGALSRMTSSHSGFGWIDAVGAAVSVLSGVLCVMVVRGIDARRQERMRRLLAQAIAAERPRWPSPGVGSEPIGKVPLRGCFRIIPCQTSRSERKAARWARGLRCSSSHPETRRIEGPRPHPWEGSCVVLSSAACFSPPVRLVRRRTTRPLSRRRAA